MKLNEFYYDLPEELIAQVPIKNRDESRLLVVDRNSKDLEHKKFNNIKTGQEIYQEYIDYHTAWEKKSAEYYSTTENPTWGGCLEYCGENKYPGPLCPRNPFHATALYESMIKRVAPYTIAGFMYYQGESDDDRPQHYYKMLRGLITLWRDDWGDDELPFLIVQLPMHRYEADEDRKNWCLIREAQEKVFRTIKNTGLAVILDCGEFNEIHPKDKEQVGHRLYLQAMNLVYGDKETNAFSINEYNKDLSNLIIVYNLLVLYY